MQAALKLIFWTLVGLLIMTGMGMLAAFVGTFVAALSGILFGVWAVFSLFCLWFFRDPNPRVPPDANVIVPGRRGQAY